MAAVAFTLNGAPVEVGADDASPLEALRNHLGVRSPKDGCSPQGQCGCCTVWVDGQPRVGCVTRVTRVAGRAVTTVEGLPTADEWADRLCAVGGSQCGFCTPGIVMRLAAIEPERRNEPTVRQALLAHLCRCTGWNSVVAAACAAPGETPARDRVAAERRAAIEGQAAQCLENVRAILEAAGSDLQHVLRCGVFLTDMNEFQKMNSAYARAFGAHRPARTTVQVSKLPHEGLRVEIDAIAYKP